MVNLKRAIFALVLIGIFAAQFCCLCFAVSEQELKAVAIKMVENTARKNHPEWGPASFKVSFKYADSTFSSLSARGKVLLAIVDQSPGFDPIGDTIVPFQVYVNGVSAEKIFMRARVEAWMDIVVSSKKLSKKTILGDADLKLSSLDVSTLPKTFHLSFRDILGKELLSSISSGVVIYDWMVRIPPTIAKNDQVTIVAESPSFRATATGIALEDGYVGKKIKVRNIDTKKEIKATVASSCEVRIDLERGL